MAKITEYLELILEGENLTFEQSKELLDTIFDGEVADVQIAAFLAAMRVKRATVEELAGLASSLRSHCVKVETGLENVVDTCGTGGAKLKTFNISTAAALVAAGAGVPVAKHGNRGITSSCGSADVLEALGVNVEASPDVIAECITKAGVGFMFAPRFHPAMKHVQPVRKSLDFRTAFNILGPLANPANATGQVMGVPSDDMMMRIAKSLQMLGIKKAMVVHSEGLDEISTLWPTKIATVCEDDVKVDVFDPRDHGIELARFDDLKGKDAQVNAEIVKGVITGKLDGPKKDIVLINAAAAIMVGLKADNFDEGLAMARESIQSGKAQGSLDKLVEISNG
ncbi:Anthranilate phosphoribosyltransferase 2 [Anaerohalosphaera lusitana]|uniref:Anthranilate phosphoribosyltransferase n=1 Tax=Anaerohalosphaera lusitana TaxID=1936003 RepID=A0A1U9NLG8_9BACT|nr:anthranilate phosphoribosyltransferase [Anaerohalosphaera lusitana]AQT68584.1 Anthranilate phosphoribosyltransferase 2 [Anaerohalosphaera lusitana]